MTSLVPEPAGDGLVKLKGEGFALVLRYNPKKTELLLEEKPVEDGRLRNNWGDTLYRLVFRYRRENLSDQLEFVITGQEQ